MTNRTGSLLDDAARHAAQNPMPAKGRTYTQAELDAHIGAAEKRGEEKWFADAKLMLGFAELAYAAGAKPSSSDLIAAKQRVLDRVRREARVEGMRAALAVADTFDNPLLDPTPGYVDATQAIAALIAAEERREGEK